MQYMKNSDTSVQAIDISSMGKKSSRVPSYVHGWQFLTVVESQNPEALAIKSTAANIGPAIVYNPDLISFEDLECPSKAMLWLPTSLHQICTAVLSECLVSGDNVGRFTSSAWVSFRNAATMHVCMEWDEIISATKREGIDFMAEHISACLFVESGLQDSIQARLSGTFALKIA